MLIKCFAGDLGQRRERVTMPIYEYRCSSCGHQLEVLQKFSDPPQVECPHCHRPDLVKLVSPVGFQLKGSGWYVTDFRNSGAKPARKPDEKRPGDTDAAAKDASAAAGAGSDSGNGSDKSRDGATGGAGADPSKAEGKSSSEASSAKASGGTATSAGSSSDSASGSSSGSSSGSTSGASD